MLTFISKLFRRPLTFVKNSGNFVNVLDTNQKNGTSESLFNGFVMKVDFNKRLLYIELTDLSREGIMKVIPFDDVVTINRMKDGRIRMWIKN